MTELAVIAEPAEASEITPGAPADALAQTPEAPAGVALADLLVEEVSIDGMCGVY
jgi:mycofactocin precursor